jgi:hypothetical protein
LTNYQVVGKKIIKFHCPLQNGNLYFTPSQFSFAHVKLRFYHVPLRDKSLASPMLEMTEKLNFIVLYLRVSYNLANPSQSINIPNWFFW